MRTGDGAARADLFLHSDGSGEVADGATGRSQLFHDAACDENARLIVEAARHGQPAAEPLEPDAIRNGITHVYAASHLVSAQARVDDELVKGSDGLAIVGLYQMDGLAADNAADRPACRMDIHAHAGQDGGIHATDGRYGQKALIGYVGDHEANFVHVRCQHEGRARPASVQRGMHRSHGISLHPVSHF